MIRRKLGHLSYAPEGFVPAELVSAVTAHGIDDTRRAFLRSSFAAALLGSTVIATRSSAAEGELEILEKQPWQTTLGKPVAATPYGLPSVFEKNLQRRESPGLTRLRHSKGCLASSRRVACISNVTIRAGWISIRQSTA